MPPDFPRRYTQLLAREIILRKKDAPGTMPADMKIIRAVLEAKFADKKFTQALVNDVLATRGVTVVMK